MVNSLLLAGFPIFKDVSPVILDKIAVISEEHAFSAGQTVFREGERADKLHFLLQGSIALRVNIMTRPESVTVSYISKGNECFGWSGLISPHYYTASAYCEEDSQVMTVSGEALLGILESDPKSGFKVMHRMANLISDRLRNSRLALLKTL